MVTGRLEEAMDAYRDALALDPDVDDAAVEDLENALELYPTEASIHYPLATLYEQEGRRDEAARQFSLYLQRGASPPFDGFARQRLKVLTAPPAPIEISDGVRLALGLNQLSAEGFQPGDRIVPTFELFTEGEELPKEIEVRLSVEKDGEVLSEETATVSLPQAAIGFVVDTLGVTLPSTLAQGRYDLVITALASSNREATYIEAIDVSGSSSYLRQLLSRDIVMLELGSDVPFFTESDLSRTDEVVISTLVSELQATADAAKEALPMIEEGRFAGQDGGEVFAGSTEEDVRVFLGFLLSGNTSDATFHFVDAYAQWAVDGGAAEEQ